MAAVILEPNKIKSLFPFFPHPLTYHEVIVSDAMIFIFWMFSFKSGFSLSSFTFIKRLFSSCSLSAIRMVAYVYLRLLIFLLAILNPVCESSNQTFYMVYSVQQLNKQDDNIQPWCTPFLSQFLKQMVPCSVVTVASWPEYRFLRRQLRWSGIPISMNFPQFVVIHTVKGFCILNETEVDAFLEFSFFNYNPTDAGYLTYGSSAFSKSNLYVWKSLIHVLLKPSFKNSEHYLADVRNEQNCVIVLTFFGFAFI